MHCFRRHHLTLRQIEKKLANFPGIHNFISCNSRQLKLPELARRNQVVHLQKTKLY